jgi:hypothetical protein
MMSLVRWLKNCWNVVGSTQRYALQEANPPRIRQLLDRYTN